MIFLSILFLSALFISSIAAWFSIAGLVAIFPGAKIAIILMGASLEMAKLVTASWLYRFWDKANFVIKAYFIVAVVSLSFITSIGIFGYLTKSHVEGSVGMGANVEQLTLIDEQISIERENIQQQRILQQQLDGAVNNLLQRENTTERAVAIRNSQRRDRTAIAEGIKESNVKIQTLQEQRLEFSATQRELEREVGPIKYIAQLVYSSDDTQTIEKAVQLLTLLIVFVFDPLAILLVVAANMQIKELNTKNIIVQNTPPVSKIDNVTEMNDDWNPNSWFKFVKSPKSKDS